MAIADGADAVRERLVAPLRTGAGAVDRRLTLVDHPPGVRRLTGLRLLQPPRDDPDDPTKVLTRFGLAKVERDDA